MGCGTTLTKRVERIQKYCLRAILRKPPLTSSELLRQTLGWTTLKTRRHNAMLCRVHRCCTNQAPPCLCSKFIANSNLNYARTRGSNKLHLPRQIFTTRALSFKELCILTSYVPENIRGLKERKQLKIALLKYNI